MIFPDFSFWQFLCTGLIFIWAGFVRSGLGFGGAALGLPLMLLVYDQAIYWIPVIGQHLLFFSGLTLRTRLHNVDWRYLKESGCLIMPAAIAGVFGLVSLPNTLLLVFIYSITLGYAVLWMLDRAIHSQNLWLDRLLLVFGGYVSGTSLTGAPLMIAVFMRNVQISQLRNTLFVLWFIIVTLKLLTLVAFGVELHFTAAVVLLPVAAIGHWAGLRLHDYMMERDRLMRRFIGGFLTFVCLLGLGRIWLGH